MKKAIFYFALMVLSFQTASCQGWFGNDRVKGNGDLITKNRNVPDYDEIAVSGFFTVELVSGTEGKLEIQAESNLMEYIVTEVENGTLKIKIKRNINLNPTEEIKIIVPFEEIHAVALSGSGEVFTRDKIITENFDFRLSGSGDASLAIKAKNIDAQMSGSGDINLKGTAEEFEISISGSGDVDAENLQAKRVDARVSGSGDINIFASEALSARVSGSGDITYKGNPEKQDFRTSGSGSVSSD
ncbi:MAG TPA: head GIN domain-containing protein [Salinimicrobium sp.]|nr:head GIN domain-containing protein [Salinimicrobium sp.]